MSQYVNNRPLFCRSYIQPSTDGGTRDLPAEETLRALRALETDARTSMGEALVTIIKVQRRTATVVVLLARSLRPQLIPC